MLPSGAHVRLKRLTLNGKIYGRDLTRTWSVLSPDADVQMRYTSTETGRIASVLHTCYDEFAADDVVPVGRLFTGIALRIVREDGSDAPVGEIGRLLVRSDRHALGDVGEGNGTRRFDDGAPLFDTQDLASLDEQGRLRIFGRSGDVVKMNGYIAST
jgi:acyl-coenzyme A synthetase/AMP-(fatty) acid ligase